MSTEIILYLKSLKEHMRLNNACKQYFLTGVNEDEFFKKISIVSEKNFTETGDPTLTVSQLEEIRNFFKPMNNFNVFLN